MRKKINPTPEPSSGFVGSANVIIPAGSRVCGKKAKEPSLAESFRESFENPTFILSSIVVVVCSIRFLLDGSVITLFGQTLTFSMQAAATYAAILTPVLGAHSYIRAKGKVTQTKQKAENPDEPN